MAEDFQRRLGILDAFDLGIGNVGVGEHRREFLFHQFQAAGFFFSLQFVSLVHRLVAEVALLEIAFQRSIF